MKPVDATIVHDPAKGQYGDCFRACLASVLELDIEDVPHFCDGDNPKWFDDADAWISRFGLSLFSFDRKGMASVSWMRDDSPYLVSGQSPRGDFCHGVIYMNGKMIHDPHPSRDGILHPVLDYIVFVATDPAKFARIEATAR